MGKTKQQVIHYETIFAGIPKALLVIDSDGLIQHTNARCTALTGLRAEEVIGRALAICVEPTYRALFRQHFETVATREKPDSTCEVTIIGKQGPSIPVSMTLWLIQEEPTLLGVFVREHLPDSLAEALQDSAAALNSTLDLDEVLDRILDNVRRVVDYEAADIMILEKGVFRVAGSRGYEPYGIGEWISAFEVDTTKYPVWQKKIQQSAPSVTPDTQQSDGWDHIEETAWIRSNMHIPIMDEGELIGFINLNSAQPNFFTKAQITPLIPFSNQAATAIRNARLFAAEREQRVTAEALTQITASLISTLDLDELFSRLLDSVGQVVPHQAANVMLIEDGIAHMVNGHGYEQYGVTDYLNTLAYRVADVPNMQKAVEEATTVLVADTRDGSKWVIIHPGIDEWQLSNLKSPIRIDGEVVGFINLDSDQVNGFNARDAQKLQSFADLAAIAIKNARLFTAEQEQRAIAEAQAQVTTSLISTPDLTEVFAQLLEAVEQVVPHEAANVMLIEDGLARIVSWRGYEQFDMDEHYANMVYEVENTPHMRTAMKLAEPDLVPDTHADEHWIIHPGVDDWLRSHVKAPILLDDRPVGFINLDSDRVNAFNKQDALKLQAFCNQAAIAIRNARLFQAERDQRRLAEALQDTSITLNQTLELDEVLERILDNLHAVIPHDTANIMLLEHGGLRAVGSRGYDKFGLEDWISNVRFPPEHYPIWLNKHSDPQPFIVSDAHSDPLWVSMPQTGWIRSHINVPIVLDREILGFINLDSTQPNFFTQAQAAPLITFSYQAATAIRNARLFATEQEQRQLAEAVHASIAALNQTLDLDEVLDSIIDQIEQLLPRFDRIVIGFLEGSILRIARARGTVEVQRDYNIHSLGMDVKTVPTLDRMRETRQPIAIADTRTVPNWSHASVMDWIRSYVGVPLKLGDQMVGLIGVGSATPYHFDMTHARLVESFAEPASAAIYNARLYADLAQERMQLKAILDGTGEGIIYSEGLHIVFVNQMLCELTGYHPSELLGEPISMLRGSPDTEHPLFSAEHMDDIILPEGTVGRQRIVMRRKDGTVFDASITLSRVGSADEQPIRAVTIVRDLSHEKRLSAMQNRFITHSAHELRQPIASIQTRLYLLEKTPENLEKHVQVIRQASDRLTALTEHMSLISQFDMGEIKLERMSIILQDLLEPTIAQLQEAAAKRDIIIITQWPLERSPLPLDNMLLTQLTRLLLSNAIVHSAPASNIDLQFDCVDDSIMMVMKDARPQLPEDQLDQAFQPFYIPSQGTIVHTGLELTIIHHIVDLYDGHISIENRAGERGTLFRIELPL